MSDSTTGPFPGKSFKVHWADIVKVVAWLLPFVITGVLLYLRHEFATHTSVDAKVQLVRQDLKPLEALPARVGSLEEHRARAEKAADKTEAKFEAIQGQLAEMKTMQAEQTRTLNRILDNLDRQR